MTGFETFDVKAWLVDGFTKHVGDGTQKKFGTKRKNSRKLVVGISILAAMASVNDVTVPVASAAQTDFGWPQQSIAESPDVVQKPEKYWPELVRVISTWEDVDETDTEDIPTIL